MNTQADNYLKFMDDRTLGLCAAIRILNKAIKKVKHTNERDLLVLLIEAKINLAFTLETHLLTFGGNNNGYFGYTTGST